MKRFNFFVSANGISCISINVNWSAHTINCNVSAKCSHKHTHTQQFIFHRNGSKLIDCLKDSTIILNINEIESIKLLTRWQIRVRESDWSFFSLYQRAYSCRYEIPSQRLIVGIVIIWTNEFPVCAQRHEIILVAHKRCSDGTPNIKFNWIYVGKSHQNMQNYLHVIFFSLSLSLSCMTLVPHACMCVSLLLEWSELHRGDR